MSDEQIQTACIARHGNRLDFVDPEWFKTAARPYDSPLSEDGIEQARALGRRLVPEHIAHIFCSPFLRSVATAHEVANLLGLHVNVEPGLNEWLNAEWFRGGIDLLPADALASRFASIDPRYAPRWVARFPESGEAALERAAHTALRLVDEFPGTILLVGHGASVLGATAGLLGLSGAETQSLLQPIHYCCLVKLVRSGAQGWRLKLNGSTDHLRQTDAAVRFV